MAKKISYRAVPIEKLTSALVAGMLAGATKLVVAIDVVKTKMMAGFGREDGSVARLVRFESPMQTRAFVDLVVETGQALAVPVEALVEPTGTYGEGLRALLVGRGVSVFMLSPKRVHDAREVFDGVPSLHDAKSCAVMAQLHRQGVSRTHSEASPERVRLRALVRQREVFETPLRLHLGMLEGLCGRHWPELLAEMDVWRRRTPLELLAAYGGVGLSNASLPVRPRRVRGPEVSLNGNVGAGRAGSGATEGGSEGARSSCAGWDEGWAELETDG